MAATYPGKFIVLDGPEGAGKTLQVERLIQSLRRAGRQATAVRDPGSTPVSERIRDILLDKRLPEMDVRTEVFLYMASRAEMVARIIRPALQVGLVVVSDRFVSSTAAYQGAAGGVDAALIWELGRIACGGIEPDLTVILDLDVEAGFARREQQRQRDRIELKDREYHEKVRQGFLAMARERPDRFAVVDAARPPDDVARDIEEAVMRVLR
ncbi:MAG: dTMP kinase [Planctomycetota bacterium]|nr:dTMP kinase [Planctomycetota bacterium]